MEGPPRRNVEVFAVRVRRNNKILIWRYGVPVESAKCSIFIFICSSPAYTVIVHSQVIRMPAIDSGLDIADLVSHYFGR